MLILRDLCQHLDWGDPMFRGVCQHHEFGRLHQQRPKQLRPEEEKKVGKDTGATQAAEPHWSRSASRYPKALPPPRPSVASTTNRDVQPEDGYLLAAPLQV